MQERLTFDASRAVTANKRLWRRDVTLSHIILKRTFLPSSIKRRRWTNNFIACPQTPLLLSLLIFYFPFDWNWILDLFNIVALKLTVLLFCLMDSVVYLTKGCGRVNFGPMDFSRFLFFARIPIALVFFFFFPSSPSSEESTGSISRGFITVAAQ